MSIANNTAIASRAKRFFAFAIDQTILGILGIIIFISVFATQTQQLRNATDGFFRDPLWTQVDKLSANEFDTRLDTLMASPKVTQSVEALAHPFALATGISLLASAAYYLIPTKKWGATLGKRWLKIKVQNLDGSLLDWLQSSIRYFIFIGIGTFSSIVTILDLIVNKAFLPSNTAVDVLTLILSQVTWITTIVCIVMICVRVDRRGLHDIAARTIVRDLTAKTKGA